MSEIAGIRPVERSAGAPSPIESVQPAQGQRRAVDAPERTDSRLDPAVTLDIRDEPSGTAERPAQTEYRSRYVKDSDSRQIVFQVIDPGSGTVMVQLPSPQAIEARTYAEAAASHAAKAAEASARGQPVDRTA